MEKSSIGKLLRNHPDPSSEPVGCTPEVYRDIFTCEVKYLVGAYGRDLRQHGSGSVV